MAGVTVLRNFSDLRDLQLLTKDDWGALGRVARERIIDRTQAGRDEDERTFRPYSAAYQFQRAKEGLKTTPDLQVSGEMLRAIVVEPDDKGVTLTIR